MIQTGLLFACRSTIIMPCWISYFPSTLTNLAGIYVYIETGNTNNTILNISLHACWHFLLKSIESRDNITAFNSSFVPPHYTKATHHQYISAHLPNLTRTLCNALYSWQNEFHSDADPFAFNIPLQQRNTT